MSRPYRGEADLPRLARFLTRARAATAGHCGYYHPGDLYWNLFLATLRGEIPENLRLWEDASAGEDDLLGFAWYYPPDIVDIQTAPWHPDRDALEAEMLRWARQRRRVFPGAAGGPARKVSTTAFEKDARWIAVLEREGFTGTPDHKIHLVYDFADPAQPPIPPATLPAGFTVRSVGDRDAIAERAAAQKAVWPWTRVTPENYSLLQSLPGYDAEMDLVCVAPDGATVACFALCWLDARNRIGEFEPVGTPPPFRRKGLARALLWEGLRRLRERGASAALVYPEGGDAPAERLYLSAGFRPLQRQFVYSGTVE